MLSALLKLLGFAAWADRSLDLTPPPPSRPTADNGPITYRQHERIEAELSTLYAMCDPFTGETHRALAALTSREATELIRKLADFNRELAAVFRTSEAA